MTKLKQIFENKTQFKLL